uniref:Uncharacterized protein n=1 Tax=Anguilla anguilla TaxID=7936 RepID=A0A0E9VDE2_ANGAN
MKTAVSDLLFHTQRSDVWHPAFKQLF